MNEITLMFLLLWSLGSQLTSAVYVRSPEEVLDGNGTAATDCGVPAIKPVVNGCPTEGLGIINGREAVPHSWPWQVSLQDNNGHHGCGGSLIGRNWVVTAAHCDISEFDHHVVLGLHDRGNTSNAQTMRIGKVFNHPNWNNNTFDNDIALIKLQRPAQMNCHVSPVYVAETGDNLYVGMYCVATGWGLTQFKPRETPLKLQQACLPLISHDKCKSYDWGRLQYNLTITSQMICAGAAGSGTCKGDSGGPLVCIQYGAWTLVGVASFGYPGCPTNKPDVFAYVPNLRSWMVRTIADNP